MTHVGEYKVNASLLYFPSIFIVHFHCNLNLSRNKSSCPFKFPLLQLLQLLLINSKLQAYLPRPTLSQPNLPTNTVTMAIPASTCCKTTQGAGCVCAAQAKCSCGKESALHCTCSKAASENEISGPRCSCRKLDRTILTTSK